MLLHLVLLPMFMFVCDGDHDQYYERERLSELRHMRQEQHDYHEQLLRQQRDHMSDDHR